MRFPNISLWQNVTQLWYHHYHFQVRCLSIFCNLKLMYKRHNYLGIGQLGRSSIYFTTLTLLYSSWNERELARQVAFMPCLIGLIKTDSFDEAMAFVDKISSIPGNKVKSKKKYLVINTPTVDQRLMQNKTGNIHVHIIKEGETGTCSVIESLM